MSQTRNTKWAWDVLDFPDFKMPITPHIVLMLSRNICLSEKDKKLNIVSCPFVLLTRQFKKKTFGMKLSSFSLHCIPTSPDFCFLSLLSSPHAGFPQLENRRVEHLLSYLWWRLSGAQRAVCLPWCRWAPRGGGCHLCRLRWGTALSADLQHATVCRVSSD